MASNPHKEFNLLYVTYSVLFQVRIGDVRIIQWNQPQNPAEVSTTRSSMRRQKEEGWL